ncbi:MAG TPA: HDOD domain-containing protein [Thermodesulfobacteriota bacterium]|nr:HDOD domain-containing protein [Thermodesulfobacteriota bacterium]HQO77846.1 HDOD domain-containing protein [Thermodesulfobacteriota bacterium]
MNEKDKKKIFSQVQNFPSMSGAAAKLLALLDDPDTTPGQIEEVVRYEPSLTANILKLSNSAYFGLPTKVGSVKQAIILLGWKRVTQVVMTSCVSALMAKPIVGYELPAGELWRHSIGVSIAAEMLVKELKLQSAHEVYTAALLHDLGKLILGSFVKSELSVIEAKAADGIAFDEAERLVLGMDHAEVGAEILKSWSLPAEVIEIVRWHHDPGRAVKPTVGIDIVHVANVLCLTMGIGIGREGLRVELSPMVTARLGLKPAVLEIVASQTLQWVDELRDMFKK